MKILPYVIALALAGCASVPAKQPVAAAPARRMPFPEAEYAALPKTGTATVTGQAFLRTPEGEVKTGAGREIILNPVTSYSLEWYEQGYKLGKRIAAPDPRLWGYAKKQVADASGRFTFREVPAGRYFVSGTVTWVAPTVDKYSDMRTQGSVVAQEIVVKEGESVEVALTR